MASRRRKLSRKNLNFTSLEDIEIEAKAHYQTRGRPSKNQVPSHYSFHILAKLKLNPKVVQAHRTQAGRFIVATNLLDEQTWSNDKVVKEYKDQTCERGFRFLKDPLFFVSRLLLKSPKRIMVLMMVMGLALLVYSRLTTGSATNFGCLPRDSRRSKGETNLSTDFTLVAPMLPLCPSGLG